MPIKRIDMNTFKSNPDIIHIPDDEIVAIYNIINNAHKTYLSAYSVEPLQPIKEKDDAGNPLSYQSMVKQMNAKTLQLIFLYKYIGCFIHKDLISEFVRNHIPNAAKDQQVRHLGAQNGWNILNKGAHVPNTEENVPSGYHFLVSIESPNPQKVMAELKRAGRLSAKNFDQLKITYDNCCATCGIKEGIADRRNNNTKVILQQGHMDPRKKLDLNNTIPQCQYCNQTYKDYFRFNENGRVIAVNNPEFLLQSPKSIQDEMIQVLLNERRNKDGTI